MEKIIIFGAGGLAREVRFLIDEINKEHQKYEFIGYIVSDLNSVPKNDSKEEIIGDLKFFQNFKEKINVAIGVGNPKHRLKVVNELSPFEEQLFYPSLIHPNVVYDKKTCKIGNGVIICSNVNMTVNIQIGDFSLINLSCTVGHESVIGKGCILNPDVNISGGVKIDDSVMIGTGSQILQYINIGSESIIGASACVVKSIPKNVVVAGVPAKEIRKNE